MDEYKLLGEVEKMLCEDGCGLDLSDPKVFSQESASDNRAETATKADTNTFEQESVLKRESPATSLHIPLIMPRYSLTSQVSSRTHDLVQHTQETCAGFNDSIIANNLMCLS